MRDLDANLGILASRLGFSKNAKSKAPNDLQPWTVETYSPDRPEYKRTRELENLELRYHIDVKCCCGPMDLSCEAAHAIHDLGRDQVNVVFESGQ